MNGNNIKTVRLKVSSRVAQIVSKDAPRDLRLQAARGALALSAKELLTALFFLSHDPDTEIKTLSIKTLKGLASPVLMDLVKNSDLHPRLLDFLAHVRMEDKDVVRAIVCHPMVPVVTLSYISSHCDEEMLSFLAGDDELLHKYPVIIDSILANPKADYELKSRFGKVEKPKALESEKAASEDVETEEGEVKESSFSKYQQAMEMGVADKIKMALTGDKEWRGIFIKDANKLVSSAVLKNPRITDGEVLAVAKNKSSSDELIRMITLNREWIKNTSIKKALVEHPKTPLPKALRYMNVLSEKELKNLAKSRNISPVIVNSARRMLMAKSKNK